MTTPAVYTNNTPDIGTAGLSPLQLAAANFLMTGSPPAFGINQEFLTELVVFGSSEVRLPLEIDPRTGLPTPYPPLVRDVTGVAFFVRGDDLYLFRQAQNCGPDENRYEEVLIGKVKDLAIGTYAYYGTEVVSGTFGFGGGGNSGDGSGWDGTNSVGVAPGGVSAGDANAGDGGNGVSSDGSGSGGATASA